MDTITLNQIALFLFLGLNLWVAMKAMVKKPTTMRDYALANQSLGISTLMMTLFATLMSSNFIGLNVAYSNGVIGFIYPFFFACMATLLGWFVFPNLVNFTQSYTMADVMYKIYGPFARLCTVLITSLFTLVVVVIQLQAIGHMGFLLGISPYWLILGVGAFITLYTAIGGIRSVAFTDVIQFMAFWGGLFVAAYIVVSHYGGIQTIWEKIPSDNGNLKKKFFTYPNFGKRFFSAFFWAIWPTVLISPAVIQRVLMTRNKKQVRHMFMAFGGSYMFLRILTFFVGSCLFFAPKGTLPKSLSLDVIINTVSVNALAKMAFLITFLGIVMSTIDSLLNALAVMWAHSIIRPLSGNKQNAQETINLSGKITLILGLCMTLVACYNTRRMFDLVEYSYIIISCITIPFLLGVKGLKGNDTIFKLTIGSFVGIFFFMFYHLQESILLRKLIELLCDRYNTTRSAAVHNPLHIKFSWLFAVLGSSMVFFLTHYVQYGRFVMLKRDKSGWQEDVDCKVGFNCNVLTQPVAWANQKVAQYGRYTTLVGCLVLFLPALPIMLKAHPNYIFYTLMGLYALGVILASYLMADSVWYASLKRYFNIFYFFCIWYGLSFMGTFSLLQNTDNALYVTMYSGILLVLLSALVDWRSFLLMESTGIVAAFALNRMITGLFLPVDFKFSLVVVFLFFALVSILFIRPKETLLAQQLSALHLTGREKGERISNYKAI